MKTVIITGSTRGLGYGLAEAFLELDCAVVISGRIPKNQNLGLKWSNSLAYPINSP